MTKVEVTQQPNPKVLVVDDQPANLLAASKILVRLPIDVLTARSGNEALSLILRHEFAVILLDVRMPGMDGYETATLIREHTGSNPVPIIFVTAEASEQHAVFKGYESGAVDYLLKPIDEGLLLSKLRIFLDLYRHRRELQEATRALRESNLRMQKLLHAVGDGIVGIETDGEVGFVNPAACRLLECSPSQILGKPSTTLFGEAAAGAAADPIEQARKLGNFRQTESMLHTLNGRELPVEYVLSAVESGPDARTSFVLVFQDITERLKASKELRRQAELDHLTGLPNRLLFEQRLHDALKRPANRPFALLMLDLDGFKPINDNHGHAVGDFLLKAVAKRLHDHVRDTDMAARLGGDEFAVFLTGVREIAEGQLAAQNLAVSLAAPYDCGGQPLVVGASVGVAMYPSDGATAEILLAAADAAMYRAKRAQSRVAMARDVGAA